MHLFGEVRPVCYAALLPKSRLAVPWTRLPYPLPRHPDRVAVLNISGTRWKNNPPSFGVSAEDNGLDYSKDLQQHEGWLCMISRSP